MTSCLVPDASPHLALHVLRAEQGDCLVVDYGFGTKLHRVVVDGGTANTYSVLKELLDSRPDASLDLLIVTHIDADHIGGAIRLVEDLDASRRFADIWFNGLHHLQQAGSEGFGPKHGDRLTDALRQHGLPWNRAFGEQAILTGENAAVVKTLPGGASVTLLSPTSLKLQLLRLVWERDVVAAGLRGQDGPEEILPPSAGLERMGASDLDIQRLAAREWRKDPSAANGSSIAVLFEFAGKRLLLAADGHADVLTQTANVATGGGAPFSVDLFKLSHHGSAFNTNKELLDRFPADAYVVCTNGRHGHPDDETLARVVAANPRAQIIFNYANDAFIRWAEAAKRPSSEFVVRALDPRDSSLVLLPRA
jgi:beta-lactamase superfamily II metal-dependent hydrolase